MIPNILSQRIKEEANRLGFFLCGVSQAQYLSKEAKDLEKWLNQGQHGEMKWMENHFEKRVDPRKLFPGAKSIVSVAMNYFPDKSQNAEAPKISKYAYGKDYHFLLKNKLKSLFQFIEEVAEGEVNGRAFVDSAPIMDKVWAKRAGLGWVGKNTNLIHPKNGSFFFLGELVLDIELDYDTGMPDYCGTCTKCIDACPTQALYEPYKIDGSKCISYFTIELKGELPAGFENQFEDWVFGCDICQDVCPWNRFSKSTVEEWFQPHSKLLSMSSAEWKEITEEVFQEIFRKSAVKRTKFEGLKRNIEYVNKVRTKSDNSK